VSQGVVRQQKPNPKRDAVSILRVGQGDCILIESNGRYALIDTGRKDDEMDLTQRLVVPELLERKIRKIEAIFLTHPDSDHTGGLSTLQRFFSIGEVVFPSTFFQEIATRGVSRRLISGARTFRFGDLEMWVWAPPHTKAEGDNAGSLVVLVSGKKKNVLLTGDLPESKEELLVTNLPKQKVDVLKAGHHGSSGSTGWGLLRAVQPSMVVFSHGRNNPFGHPSKDVLARCSALGINTWSTARSGTYECVLGDD
jgi:competence protein ComEC